MATPDNYAALTDPNSGVEPERLSLTLVGNRGYVRALELVSQLRNRFPNANLAFRFRQPMTCDVVLTKTARSDWSSQITIEIDAKKERYFIVNVDSEKEYRTPEAQLIPHLVLFFGTTKQRYLTLASDEGGLLGLILETYQKRTNTRWAIVSIKLVPLPARHLQFVAVEVETMRQHWLKGRISVNSHHWVEICVRSR
jgi:hypothetical protein